MLTQIAISCLSEVAQIDNPYEKYVGPAEEKPHEHLIDCIKSVSPSNDIFKEVGEHYITDTEEVRYFHARIEVKKSFFKRLINSEPVYEFLDITNEELVERILIEAQNIGTGKRKASLLTSALAVCLENDIESKIDEIIDSIITNMVSLGAWGKAEFRCLGTANNLCFYEKYTSSKGPHLVKSILEKNSTTQKDIWSQVQVTLGLLPLIYKLSSIDEINSFRNEVFNMFPRKT